MCPKTNRPHWQGYVQFIKRKTFKTAQNDLEIQGAHFEKQRGRNDQARDYCKKEESRAIPYEHGEFGTFREGANEQGARNDIKRFMKDIMDRKVTQEELTDKHPECCVKYPGAVRYWSQYKKKPDNRNIHTYVFWGATGTGKTKLAHEIDKDIYRCIYGQGRIWFNGYSGEKTLLLDEFHGGRIDITDLLMYLDPYPLQVETKGGAVWANWTTVIITSNLESKKWYKGSIHPEHEAALQRRLTDPIGTEINIDSWATADKIFETYFKK